MINFFKRILGGGERSTAVAKSRLHFVLVQDRSGLNQEELNEFRREMIQVIDKYFAINEKDFELSYERGDDTTTLVINSPVTLKRVPVKGNKKSAKIADSKSNDSKSMDDSQAVGGN